MDKITLGFGVLGEDLGEQLSKYPFSPTATMV